MPYWQSREPKHLCSFVCVAEPLTGWRVFPLPLTSLDGLNLPDVSKPAAPAAIAPTAAASKSTTAAKSANAAKSAAAVKLAAAATKSAAAVKNGAAAKVGAAAESASHAHVQPRPTESAVSFAAVQTPKAELARVRAVPSHKTVGLDPVQHLV